MRIKETKIYQYTELSDGAKEKARQWYLGDGLDYDWWNGVYEDATQIAAILGIDIDKIYFSGFWSQGDGACFEGSYSYKKSSVKAIKEYATQDNTLQNIAQRLQATQKRQFYKLIASCKQRGHYNHSGCMSVSVEHSENRYRDIGDAETDIAESMRDFADWIYKQLEKEYDYLTSDESIEESIIANEYEFNEDGSPV